eukprot:m.124514 g.124514  ORF g.124514 m.124514 type:complete len:782 (+) comp15596_c0_seq6:1439-3784(+)
MEELQDLVDALPLEEAWTALEAFLSNEDFDHVIVGDSGLIPKLVTLLETPQHQNDAAGILLLLASSRHALLNRTIANSLDQIFRTRQLGWNEATLKTVVDILVALARALEGFQAVYPRLVDLMEPGSSTEVECSLGIKYYASSHPLKRQILESAEFAKICSTAINTAEESVQDNLMDAFTTLSFAAPEKLYEAGVAPVLVHCLITSDRANLLAAAYDVARNLTISCFACKQYLADHGLDAIQRGLVHHASAVRVRACSLIRNIGAGDSGSDSRVRRQQLAETGMINTLLDILEHDEDAVKLPAAYAAWNISACPASADLFIASHVLPRILKLYNSVTFDKIISGECFKGRLVGLLCCISAHAARENVPYLCNLGLPHILHELMISHTPDHQPMNAMLGLANLIGSVENHPLLEGDTRLFQIFIDCMEHARRGAQFHGAVYTEELLLPSLAKLSISDSNKRLLKETGCVNAACTGFRVGSKGNVVDECIAKLLLNMSFAFNLEVDFEMDLIALLEDIRKKSASDWAKALAANALFQHQQQTFKASGTMQHHHAAQKRRDSQNNYVMISCSESWRPSMERLEQYLQAQGFQCRLGIREAAGEPLDVMASCVEGASVVIICVASAYKDSAACRSEGEYAHHLGKPILPVLVQPEYKPDGWLQALVRARAAVNLFFDHRFHDGCVNIANQVDMHCARAKMPSLPSSPDRASSPTSGEPPEKKQPTSPPLRKPEHPDDSSMGLLLQQLTTQMRTGFLELSSAVQRIEGRLSRMEQDVRELRARFGD